ncbi:MAG: hypothetical protein R3C61_20280 [Bacteroidia bacterium]
MKKLILLLAYLCLMIPMSGQPQLRGVIRRHVSATLSMGDTVSVRAIRSVSITPGTTRPGDTTLYYIRDRTGMAVTILPKNLRLFPDTLSFWEKAWMLMNSESVLKSGWYKTRRDSLEMIARQRIRQMEEWQQIYRDPFLEDYLRQKLAMIHPGPMIREKGRERHFRLLLTLNEYESPVVFEEGTILANISWLTAFRSEKALVAALAELVCHSVGDHFVQFSPLGYRYISSPNATQTRYAQYFSQMYMQTLPPATIWEDSVWFTSRLAGAVTRHAWLQYELRAWKEAAQLTDRLIDAGIATDEVFLLRAMIARNADPTTKGNLTALGWIQKAERNAVHIPLELGREKSLALMALGRWADALGALEEYQEALLTAEGRYEDIKWVRDMIFMCQIRKNPPPSAGP